MKDKYRTLIKDTFIFSLGSIGSKFILFFLVPLYTKCLTAEEYGTSDLLFTIAQIFIPIISLDIFDSVIRFGLENRKNPENVFKVAMYVWGGGAIVSLAIIQITNIYAPIQPWKWYLYLYIVSNILLSIELNYLKVKGKNLLYSFVCIIQTLLLAVLNIVFLLMLKTGVSGYLLSNILACIAAIIAAFILGRLDKDICKGLFEKKLARHMILYSTPLIFNNLAWWVIQSSDKVMIQFFVGTAQLGLYTVATRIPSLINVIVSVFQQSWGISAVIEIKKSNEDGFYSDVFSVFTCGIFCVSVILNSIIKYFMRMYVSNEFYQSWRFIPLLVCAAAFSAIAAYFGAIYGALKKSLNNMITTVFSGVLNIVVNLCLIPKIGVQGAVIGTSFSYIFLAFVRMKDCLRFVKFRFDTKVLIINSCLILAHAGMITINFFPWLISVCTICLLVIFNQKTIQKFLIHLLRKV